jgi:uncharacterized damage-inducible protein DinB
MSGELAEFLDYLDKVHARTRRIILVIPPDDLEWAPAPDRFTFGGLIRHLAGIERGMYGETVHGRPSRYPGHGRELADGFAEVLAYYDEQHAQSRVLFAGLSDAALGAKCETPAGVPITIRKWLRLMIEHEAHHRGQMYLMLGLRGIAAPQLYGLTEQELLARSTR